MTLFAEFGDSLADKLAKVKAAIHEPSVKKNVHATLPLARKWAKLFGLDTATLLALIDVESTFKPNLISPVGATGYGQHMPKEVSAWLQRLTKSEWYKMQPASTKKVIDATARKWKGAARALFDADLNFMLTAWHLKFLIGMFGSLDLALVAYNAGEGAVRRKLNAGADPRANSYYLAKFKLLHPIYTSLAA